MKRLKDAGADERLAEAVVATLGTAVSEHVATKTDIEKLELRMTIKFYAAVGIGVGLIKALDFLIARNVGPLNTRPGLFLRARLRRGAHGCGGLLLSTNAYSGRS